MLTLLAMMFYKKSGGDFLGFIPATAYMLAIFCLAFFTKSLKDIYVNKKDIATLLLCTIYLASLLWSQAMTYGVEKLINILLVIIAFSCCAASLAKNFSFFIKINIFLFILYNINLYLEYGFIGQLAEQLGTRFRLGWNDEGSAYNPISIARYLTFGYINIAIYWFFLKPIKYSFTNLSTRILVLATFSISLVYLFLSGTKTPILAIGLTTFLFLVLNVNIKNKIRIGILFSPLILILFAAGSFNLFKNSMNESQVRFIEYRFFSPQTAIDDRGLQAERAIEHIDWINFIVGSGGGDYGALFTNKDTRDYPHNILLEVLYENGILFLSALILAIFYILKLLHKENRLIILYLSSVFIFYFINSLFSGDLIANNILFGFLFLLLNIKRYPLEINNKNTSKVTYKINGKFL